MWAKFLLAVLCVVMIAGAVHFDPARQRTLLATKPHDGPQFRLMTWNIGYAEREDDTRAHTSDLRAVAQTIQLTDPDAVALQELTGPDQLKILLGLLSGRYRGAVAPAGNSDRVEAVLVKDRNAGFDNVQSGSRYAPGALFHLNGNGPDLVLVSAHADAFSAAKRRAYVGDIVDWTRTRPNGAIVFVAGDFNFELSAGDQSYFYTDNVNHDSESYSFVLKYFRDLGRDAGDTAINDRRIDYVFGPAGETVLLRRAEVLRGAAVGRMDHWPVVVEVGL
jgi:endonuclease/exonuclease/phosphatase family metal-dependent hydrolase